MIDFQDVEKRMKGAVDSFKRDLSGLRTGRASTQLLEPISVNAYGSSMPIDQLATISAPEPQLLTVQVWDANMVDAVEKAIRESELGLNPMPEGQLIRIPIPQLTEERRKEMVKVANQYAEKAKIAIRNVRRDAMDGLKKAEKESEISEDEYHRHTDQVQDLTDKYTSMIDDVLERKQGEITTV